MNSLSWMIYAAELFDRAGPFFGFVSFATVVVGLSMLCFGTFDKPIRWSHRGEDDEYKTAISFRAEMVKRGRKIVICAIPLALTALVLPSSQTIYLIAASEAGETVVSSPEAREIFNDLKTVIKSKLKEQLPTTVK